MHSPAHFEGRSPGSEGRRFPNRGWPLLSTPRHWLQTPIIMSASAAIPAPFYDLGRSSASALPRFENQNGDFRITSNSPQLCRFKLYTIWLLSSSDLWIFLIPGSTLRYFTSATFPSTFSPALRPSRWRESATDHLHRGTPQLLTAFRRNQDPTGRAGFTEGYHRP